MKKKIKVEITLDFDDKEFDVVFHNLSGGKFEIEWEEVKTILNKVFASMDKKFQESVESTDDFTKQLH